MTTEELTAALSALASRVGPEAQAYFTCNVGHPFRVPRVTGFLWPLGVSQTPPEHQIQAQGASFDDVLSGLSEQWESRSSQSEAA